MTEIKMVEVETTTKTGCKVVEYSFVEERLGELRAKYAVIPDAETKEGYEFIRKGVRELVSCRTDIEKKRKEIKAPVLLRSKLIDSEAKRITAALSEIEAPLKAAKSEVDERKRREKEERERIERERVEAIEAVISKIERAPMQARGKSALEIETTLAQVENYEVKESDFAEFTERAKMVKEQALEKLREFHAEAVKVEEARALVESQKAEIEREKAEIEREKAEIEAARAALEAEKAKSQKAPAPIQTTEQAAADLKDGIVKTEGQPVDDETPEEQAAMRIAFTCSLGNQKARAVVEMIKTGNVPFIYFSENKG